MNHPILIEYISGVAGGVAVVCVGHPFDTCKTRLQTAPYGFYSSSLDCFNKTYKNEGLKGFYSGVMSPLLGQMFFRAASFTTFKYVLQSTSSSSKSPLDYIRAGAVTGFFIASIEAPIDLVKTKLQTQVFGSKLNPEKFKKIPYNTVRGCIKYTIQTHGLKALWQGYCATVIRNIPANSLFFPVCELTKNEFSRSLGVPTSELPLYCRLVAGASAGLCYWVLTFPLDAIKATIQATPYEEQLSWIKTAQKMRQKYGWRAFIRGLLPCALRAVPACSAMFATVDITRGVLLHNLNSSSSS